MQSNILKKHVLQSLLPSSENFRIFFEECLTSNCTIEVLLLPPSVSSFRHIKPSIMANQNLVREVLLLQKKRRKYLVVIKEKHMICENCFDLGKASIDGTTSIRLMIESLLFVEQLRTAGLRLDCQPQ
jgi:hypothetical protein